MSFRVLIFNRLLMTKCLKTSVEDLQSARNFQRSRTHQASSSHENIFVKHNKKALIISES